ncbi:MAG: hypothetical protein ACRENX_07660 [Candidatus Dormibacteria bacterium]
MASAALGAVFLVLLAGPVPAQAAFGGAPASATLSGSGSITGSDVSYPQCGGRLPFGQAFGVVGVNSGRDNTLNPCLDQELGWAGFRSTGVSAQPKVSVYLNTGDPGNSFEGLPIVDWPFSGNTPYGVCLPTLADLHFAGPGQVSRACAFEYGRQKAAQDQRWLDRAAEADGLATAARAYPVWLDVEDSNTWQPASVLNVADLQGMVDELKQAGVVTVGVYALPAQWQELTGGANGQAFGSAPELEDWILGANSLQAAEAECASSPFAGAGVALTQFPLGNFDGDYSC